MQSSKTFTDSRLWTSVVISCHLDFPQMSVWLLLVTCTLINTIAVLAQPNTVDLLQDQPVISEDYIAQKTALCDMRHLCSLKEMTVDAICGSDGRTYNSPCEINIANCHGNLVRIQLKGPCPEKSKCRLEKTFQESVARRKNITNLFIPDCDPDGSYAKVQCHASTGYCWCVTKTGRPLPGTSVQFKNPNCAPLEKVGRRSSRKGLGRRRKGHQPEVSKSLDRLVIEWKFVQLDRNRDRRINRREMRLLKRLVRKFVKPRGCARRFTKHCDLNNDRKVSRNEWLTCLEVDINRPVDCAMHRQRALAEHAVNPGSAVYVPDCRADDSRKYAAVQCHKLTQYCWCADADQGKPLPDTSIRFVKPTCELIRVPFKGCSGKRRQRFFKRFHYTLSSSMIALGYNTVSEDMSSKEMVVRWKFRQLDSNANGTLERREWKVYRLEMKTWKGVKKCGRNFIRFCDVNKDKRISMSEWIQCTLKSEVAPHSRNVPRPPPGKNPLLTILDPNQ